jgi:putative membrane protein
MVEYLKPAALIGSVVYSAIGILLMIIGFVVIDKITPYDLWKELMENRNQPLATVVAAFTIAIAIIIAAAIHGG